MTRPQTEAELMRECVAGAITRGTDQLAAEQVCRRQLAKLGIIETPLARVPGYDPEPPQAQDDAPGDAPKRTKRK